MALRPRLTAGLPLSGRFETFPQGRWWAFLYERVCRICEKCKCGIRGSSRNLLLHDDECSSEVFYDVLTAVQNSQNMNLLIMSSIQDYVILKTRDEPKAHSLPATMG
jgi:hypothetical protein